MKKRFSRRTSACTHWDAERYKSGQCKECAAERSKAQYEAMKLTEQQRQEVNAAKVRIAVRARKELHAQWELERKTRVKAPQPEIVTRDKARSLGLGWYMTGKRCKYGHVSKRDYSSMVCRECKKMDRSLAAKVRAERTPVRQHRVLPEPSTRNQQLEVQRKMAHAKEALDLLS